MIFLISILLVVAGAVLLMAGWKGDREKYKKTAIALVIIGGLIYLIFT
jgi:hypothetical protein